MITFIIAENYDDKEIVKNLLKYGQNLTEKTEKLFKEFLNRKKEHLLECLEEETEKIKPLIESLKNAGQHKYNLKRLCQLHIIEEKLLHIENRIDEELEVINELIKNHIHRNKTIEQMIEEGQFLIKKIYEAIKENRISPKNLGTVKYNLELLERMIDRLKKQKPDQVISLEDEEKLALLEIILKKILKSLFPMTTTTTIIMSTNPSKITTGDTNLHTTEKH